MQSGRCAKCRQNTTFERVPCEFCKDGVIHHDHDIQRNELPEAVEYDSDCLDCGGHGFTMDSVCCGWGELDEAGAVDAWERDDASEKQERKFDEG